MQDEDSPRQWLEPMIKTWRVQVFSAWRGAEGWPARTILARIIEEGAGATHSGVRGQRVFEVYKGDGLAIRRAIEGMPLLPRLVLAAHYLTHGKAADKAKALRISKSRYWSLLDAAYYYLAGHVRGSDERR